ncbi:homologous-pairing protein 2 homolog [Bidens hawaiensis]|uniref:homologous-pairing protein 2 homolog n=1 Tax=Bidens hawaiensis TaxID=980011 RepID=UPI0040496871
MKEENARLQELLDEQKKSNSQLEGEIKSLQSNLTLDEIQAKDVKLRQQVKELEERLTKLREGVTLVSPEERKIVEKTFSDSIGNWRKRKRMFKDVWDTITENSPKNPNEFKEELGIEYDEDIGVSLQTYATLMPHGHKRARG